MAAALAVAAWSPPAVVQVLMVYRLAFQVASPMAAAAPWPLPPMAANWPAVPSPQALDRSKRSIVRPVVEFPPSWSTVNWSVTAVMVAPLGTPLATSNLSSPRRGEVLPFVPAKMLRAAAATVVDVVLRDGVILESAEREGVRLGGQFAGDLGGIAVAISARRSGEPLAEISSFSTRLQTIGIATKATTKILQFSSCE